MVPLQKQKSLKRPVVRIHNRPQILSETCQTNYVKRLNEEREIALKPIRLQAAIDAVTKAGIDVIGITDDCIDFYYNGHKVTYWVYSGWATGKSIKDGRGLKNLISQLITPKEIGTVCACIENSKIPFTLKPALKCTICGLPLAK